MQFFFVNNSMGGKGLKANASFFRFNLLLKARIKYPGFSWDRVSFHKKLVGMTQTANQMRHSIPCDGTLSI